MRIKATWMLTAAALIVTGCSNQTKNFTVQENSVANQSVNGCVPHSVFGPFCLSTVPVWTQSSAGVTEWSQIEVGATVEVKGATALNTKTGKPDYEAVEISGPGDFSSTLSVASNGGFDQKVTFPREGTYHIGVVQNGQQQQGLLFSVYYVPHPKVSTTLTRVFPDSRRTLPHDVVLVFPYGTNPMVPIEFTNADGRPASGVKLDAALNGSVTTTNAKGVAMVPLSPGKPFLGINPIYGALFSLSYLEGRVSNGVVTVWPKEMQQTGLKPIPPHVVRDGKTYYETSSALDLLDPIAFYDAYSGYVPAVYDPKTGLLTLHPLSTVRQVTLTPDGLVKTLSADAHVHPVVHSGKLYLDVPDLVTVLNTFAWASLSPNGTLRVADFLYP